VNVLFIIQLHFEIFVDQSRSKFLENMLVTTENCVSDSCCLHLDLYDKRGGTYWTRENFRIYKHCRSWNTMALSGTRPAFKNLSRCYFYRTESRHVYICCKIWHSFTVKLNSDRWQDIAICQEAVKKKNRHCFAICVAIWHIVAEVGKPKFCCKVKKWIAREKSYEIEYMEIFQILPTLATVCQIASQWLNCNRW